MPMLFPATAAHLYAQRFTITPCGVDPDGLYSLEFLGLAPGEFFSHALIVVEFETPALTQQASDDPNNLSQLDPEMPLLMCEQSVKSSGKMITLKAGSYAYDSDSKPVPGDFAVPVSETKLVLSFPRVPYIAWKYIKPYLNKVNLVPIFACAKGEALLESFDTKATPGPGGVLQQNLVLNFAINDGDWNMVPKPDGSTDLVHRKSGGATDDNRIYKYIDFNEIFNTLAFLAEGG
jgi:hypothetical protein